MLNLIEYAKQVSFLLVTFAGLCVALIGAMSAADRAYAKYLKYRKLWPVVARAIAEHAREISQ
ncbi:hypothetical protein UFOVP130_31 [uncultured Caudovirales phage]|uniref:Uncharacterized protein n=1 Tax=uncultured Caudovirales phage TaxID=2100421 RepID=A0A6J5L8F0_9CAUD|nr:hypothetical protein UFOVP130_31 [uncultured Caudovirales phage]